MTDSRNATNNDVERTLGRLEGRFDALDKRITELTVSLTAQITAHDMRTKSANEVLRQDFVVAITEARKRTEAVAEECQDMIREVGLRTVKLEDKSLKDDGAKDVKSAFWTRVYSMAPMVFGGGGIVSIAVLVAHGFGK